MMKLTKDDFLSYRMQQLQCQRQSMMAVEANKVLLAWIDEQIAKFPKDKKK